MLRMKSVAHSQSTKREISSLFDEEIPLAMQLHHHHHLGVRIDFFKFSFVYIQSSQIDYLDAIFHVVLPSNLWSGAEIYKPTSQFELWIFRTKSESNSNKVYTSNPQPHFQCIILIFIGLSLLVLQ